MKRGLRDMIVASFMFAVMGALVYQTKIWNPEESSAVASFLRVFFNLIIVVLLSYVVRDEGGKHLGIRGLFGDLSWALWLRGIFGSLSVICIFFAIHAIGTGESSFLNASNAVWIGLLSPWVLKQPNTKLGWTAILLGMAGLYLLYQPDFESTRFLGRTFALVSGLAGAIAYMLISRSSRTNHPLTIVFYFVFVATLLHLIWFFFRPVVLPTDNRIWWALLGAGAAASVAQIFMTMSYQRAPAALASAVSYCGPVFNMLIAILIFGDRPNMRSLVGAAVVLLSGVALPFAQSRKGVS